MSFSRRTLALSLVCALGLGASACGQDAPPPEPAPESPQEPESEEAPLGEPARGETRARTMYVPAYSHVPSERDRPVLFAITLSVRNVDPTANVTLTHVDYYDTSGHRVRRYLTAPRVLRPLETAEYAVATFDEAGGSGANFLVYWEGPSDAHPLLTEAVMIGHIGAGYVAFSSRGVELAERPTLAMDTEGRASADAGPPAP